MRQDKIVEGADKLTKLFEEMPKEAKKETKKILRKAAKPWAAKIRKAMKHATWKNLVDYKISDRKGFINLYVGLFKDPGFEWFKAYWANYGTLERRDPEHNFDRPVRRATDKRRNNLGQFHQNFFDEAREGAAEDIVRRLEQGLNQYIDKIGR